MSFPPQIRRVPHERLAGIRPQPRIAAASVDGLPAAVDMKGQAEEREVPPDACGARTVLLPVFLSCFVLGGQVFQGEPSSSLVLRKPYMHPAHVASELPRDLKGFWRVAPKDRTLCIALELVAPAGLELARSTASAPVVRVSGLSFTEIEDLGLTQRRAAEILGVDQPGAGSGPEVRVWFCVRCASIYRANGIQIIILELTK